MDWLIWWLLAMYVAVFLSTALARWERRKMETRFEETNARIIADIRRMDAEIERLLKEKGE